MKKIFYKLIILFIISNASYSLCQESQKFLGASLGVSDFHTKDGHMLPISYRGVLFSTGLSYSVFTETSRQFIDINYSGGKLNSDFRRDDVTNYAGTISYNYYWSISSTSLLDKPFEFFIGGGILSNGWYTKYGAADFYLSGIAETYYFGNYVNFSSRCELKLTDEQQLFININLPVIQFVSRPDYLTWSMSDYLTKGFKHPDYIWNNFVAQSEINYKRFLGRKIFLQLNYKFIFTGYSEPLPVKMFNNNFTASLLWSL